MVLERYAHHGFRANKSALGNIDGDGKGVPAMIVIDGGLSLEHGSDYDDHYILKNGAAPDKIIGKINLDEHNHHRSEKDVAYIAEKILKLVDSYYATENKAA